MKRINNKRINITVITKILAAVFVVAVSLPALAGYELSWYTIDGCSINHNEIILEG
jgi:hypothetical protein